MERKEIGYSTMEEDHPQGGAAPITPLSEKTAFAAAASKRADNFGSINKAQDSTADASNEEIDEYCVPTEDAGKWGLN